MRSTLGRRGWGVLFDRVITPVEIVGKLNKEINAALADARLKAQIAEFGGMILA